jgi:hypothetical protein
MEEVVEMGVFGYVCGEFGDTFVFARGHHNNDSHLLVLLDVSTGWTTKK